MLNLRINYSLQKPQNVQKKDFVSNLNNREKTVNFGMKEEDIINQILKKVRKSLKEVNQSSGVRSAKGILKKVFDDLKQRGARKAEELKQEGIKKVKKVKQEINKELKKMSKKTASKVKENLDSLINSLVPKHLRLIKNLTLKENAKILKKFTTYWGGDKTNAQKCIKEILKETPKGQELNFEQWRKIADELNNDELNNIVD